MTSLMQLLIMTLRRKHGSRLGSNRPRDPRRNKDGNVKSRDDWLNPMLDRESLRQRLFMSEEEASKVLDQEATANAFESQQALKFAGEGLQSNLGY